MVAKFIVSLTTSPKRLPMLEETLNSILQQNIKPSRIIVNTPPIFKRTGEEYPDPFNIFKDKQTLLNDIILWNKECEDKGPITKLQGALNIIDEKEDIWIITIDDDIKYLQYTIELYLACVSRIAEKNAYGLAGFCWMNDKIVPIFDNNASHIIEGYGSCCYHRSFFSNKSWNSYLNKILENDNCKFSDDVIISNWLSLNNIRRIVVGAPYINRKLMWVNKCILDYGNELDALHNGGEIGETAKTNIERYSTVKQHLESIRLLSKEFTNN
jgi:hypothetical protein